MGCAEKQLRNDVMKIVDFLKTDEIFLDVAEGSKKEVLEKVASIGAPKTGIESAVIFDALVERERLGTTGIGRGVAIPHARLAHLDDLFCTFLRVSPAVDFEAIDGNPVDLIFVLLVPEESGADHLKALARISKLLRNEEVCAKLREVKTSAEALKVIEKADAQD